MIAGVFEQALKLSGRSFVLAALLPSVLFTAGAIFLTQGYPSLQSTVHGWVHKGLGEATVDLLIPLVAAYLLAYVTYRAKAAVLRFYQGQWQMPPLSWIARPLRAFWTWRIHRYEDDLDR